MKADMKMSSLTFEDVSYGLPYVQVYWNDELVYDDLEGDEEYETYKEFKEKFNNKIVYEMNMKVVQFHHCILYIKGE